MREQRRACVCVCVPTVKELVLLSVIERDCLFVTRSSDVCVCDVMSQTIGCVCVWGSHRQKNTIINTITYNCWFVLLMHK